MRLITKYSIWEQQQVSDEETIIKPEGPPIKVKVKVLDKETNDVLGLSNVGFKLKGDIGTKYRGKQTNEDGECEIELPGTADWFLRVASSGYIPSRQVMRPKNGETIVIKLDPKDVGEVDVEEEARKKKPPGLKPVVVEPVKGRISQFWIINANGSWKSILPEKDKIQSLIQGFLKSILDVSQFEKAKKDKSIDGRTCLESFEKKCGKSFRNLTGFSVNDKGGKSELSFRVVDNKLEIIFSEDINLELPSMEVLEKKYKTKDPQLLKGLWFWSKGGFSLKFNGIFSESISSLFLNSVEFVTDTEPVNKKQKNKTRCFINFDIISDLINWSAVLKEF